MSLLEMLPARVQEAAQGVAEHGADPSGPMPMDELPDFIQHHIGDATEIEFMGGHWSLEALSIDPIQIGSLTIDLSPTRQTLVMMVVALLMLAIFIPLAGTLRKRGKEKAPSGFANAMEAMVIYFRDDVVRTNIGHGADAFTPFILTLFFFILGMNLIGLTPLGITPTANISVTAALAVITLVVVEVSGFRALGPAGYARTIFFLPSGLPGFMKPPMLVILTVVEAIGKLAKPVALTIRLMANMTAGHTLLLLLLGMIFVLQSYLMGIAAVAMGSVLMILELFVACLQAYIFAMLTSVFIGLIRHAH
ncbi:MAG: F0F1 ATP synthase subunit A [Gemmatimonadetes bacterium]|nr:F0F1 ATP synthase subunit A [Gemmatimonadota bacterium]